MKQVIVHDQLSSRVSNDLLVDRPHLFVEYIMSSGNITLSYMYIQVYMYFFKYFAGYGLGVT